MQNMNLLRNGPAAPAVAAVAFLLCLAFGSTAFTTWLAPRASWLLLPSALGAPFGLPGVRLDAVALAAVALLVVLAALWTARAARLRPEAGPVRSALSGWAAVLVGAAAGNALRGLADAAAMGLGPLGWLGFAVGGLLSGLAWGAALGWTAGVAAAALRGRTG